MKFLFVHQNFPGQFLHLAPALAARGHEVVGLGVNPLKAPLAGVRHITHRPSDPGSTPRGADSFSQEWAAKRARAQSAAKAMMDLKAEGFLPDVVFGHPGWGEMLHARDVFPQSRHLVFAEYYYGAEGWDSFFDPEFQRGPIDLASLQRLRPQVRVVIVGGDGTAYGAPPPPGTTWKNRFLDEVKGEVDMSRVHFVGQVPHHLLQRLLQVSAVHTYLTYPFVLSWSMLEAMSQGALMVASRTEPVQEVIEHGRNGLLVDFFDHQALAEQIAEALNHQRALEPLRQAARQTVVERYDLQRVCLPAMLRLAEQAEP